MIVASFSPVNWVQDRLVGSRGVGLRVRHLCSFLLCVVGGGRGDPPTPAVSQGASQVGHRGHVPGNGGSRDAEHLRLERETVLSSSGVRGAGPSGGDSKGPAGRLRPVPHPSAPSQDLVTSCTGSEMSGYEASRYRD